MRLFGDPRYPRRNLSTGALLLGLTSFRVGELTEHVFSTEVTTKDYIVLVVWLVLALLAVIDVRLGVAALPPDPKDDGSNTRVTSSAV
jgi:hypothetical protein